MTPADHTALLCEIHAPASAALNLERAVAFCAEKSGHVLNIVTREPANPREAATITLHLPPATAGGEQPIFCFICRLACLCPQARVGIFVPAQDLFAAQPISRAG